MKLLDPILSLIHKENGKHHEHESCCDEHESACSCCDGGHEHQHTYKGGLDPVIALRVVVSAVLLLLSVLLSKTELWKTILLAIAALLAGYDVIIRAVKHAIHKHVMDENLLMTVAAIAAFIIGKSYEGAAVMILYQCGELLQSYAVVRARQSVLDSFGDHPDEVTVVRAGKEYLVNVQNVAIGETVLLHPGERITFDSVVVSGESTLDMSSLTGESLPVNVAAGDELLSGAVNLSGVLYARVKVLAGESTAARILQMVQSESGKKGHTERFITRFAKIYTPIVLGLAVLCALLLPLFTDIAFGESIRRALVFLVISCPCALVISVPLSYFAGIGGAARHGIIFKNSLVVDIAATAHNVLFDKTGTLTSGSLRVTSVTGERMDPNTLLKVAAHAEVYSRHPLAKAIVSAWDGRISADLIGSFTETAGKGVRVEVDGVPILVGTAAWLRDEGIFIRESEIATDIAVYIGIAGAYAGRIVFGDDVKDSARKAVNKLHAYGCVVSMISGDSEAAVRKVAEKLDIEDSYAGCLPEQKVALIQNMRSDAEEGASVLFVGEGLNDAPAMLAADLGIAMGALGSDATIEAAEAVILDDEPLKVPGMIRIARGVRSIVGQNIIFVLVIKLVMMLLAALGLAQMWMALFADVGTAILTILNAIRALRIRMD